MNISVLIPFASEDRDRLAALKRVQAHYQAFGWQVVTAGASGEWCKAAAVAECLRHATGDMLVIADADCLCNGTPDAVEAAREGWAMPHTRVHRLTPDKTASVLLGTDPTEAMSTTERPHLPVLGGGIVALHRDLYAEVPLDPRFVGWGQEDQSWGYALHTLAGPVHQFESPLFHLWHPPAPRRTRRVGTLAGDELRRRYHAAIDDRAAMAALIKETA